MRNLPRRDYLVASLERWCNAVIDADILVDDLRSARTRADRELDEAVRDRDRAARHLEHLIALAHEVVG